ncbi:hypothetical protein N7492_006958 [Penicillium capsulatum]|uniref:PBSP domain protein n=1 Tax=Penicillium capsulatum TaxID=69766 RepID=A0A9W9LLM8_9EURO|nr:hypothetical protein N7492_006958 [Penicillium capsulatum]KAJ6116791.1 hypothetical protein N7512_006516 [Penicillium capsulatum]
MTTAPTPTAIANPSPPEAKDSNRNDASEKALEKPTHIAPRPKLRLHVEDLRHPASRAFLTVIPDVASTLETALNNIIKYLYTPSKHATSSSHWPVFSPSIPPTRSVTVFLRDFGGVAYTTGTELDDDHKEIHISLPYIVHCTAGQSAKADPLHELVGVLTHELVHCYQHTTPPDSDETRGKREVTHPPGGLIEGIADFVRLKAGLEPPHWQRPKSAVDRAPKWDAGYQYTAFFLAWIEDVRIGEGAIGMLNDRLFRVGYVGENEDEDDKNRSHGEVGFWESLYGAKVADLWNQYGEYLDGHDRKSRGDWEEEMVHLA